MDFYMHFFVLSPNYSEIFVSCNTLNRYLALNDQVKATTSRSNSEG